MVGALLEQIRKDKKMSKTTLSDLTGINVGHLTHIEKGERNPSLKALISICNALKIPYQPIIRAFEFELDEDQKHYDAPAHINYNSIPVFSSIKGFSKCPKAFYNASFAIKAFDKNMEDKIPAGTIMYVEENAPLSNRDIGLFNYNNSLIVRRFIIRKHDVVLRADDNEIEDIVLDNDDNYFIVGKILGINNPKENKFIVF